MPDPMAMNALFIRGPVRSTVLEDVRVRGAVAVFLAAAFTWLSRSYVYFDGYWSIAADVVVFLLALGIAFYGLSTLAD